MYDKQAVTGNITTNLAPNHKVAEVRMTAGDGQAQRAILNADKIDLLI